LIISIIFSLKRLKRSKKLQNRVVGADSIFGNSKKDILLTLLTKQAIIVDVIVMAF
jgi:multisubunit Na+/H+ antiporter MnhF subunit